MGTSEPGLPIDRVRYANRLVNSGRHVFDVLWMGIRILAKPVGWRQKNIAEVDEVEAVRVPTSLISEIDLDKTARLLPPGGEPLTVTSRSRYVHNDSGSCRRPA